MKNTGKIALLLVAIALLLVLDTGLRNPQVPAVATVTIKEGMTIVEINKLLQESEILSGEEIPRSLEGYIFPDTYEFYINSPLSLVLQKIEDNFNKKARPHIPEGEEAKILTIASLVEREVIGEETRRLVAGVIYKRLENSYPLQIDASICYVKPPPCHPILSNDLKIDSPYNTYMYKGLPPTPIANPGLEAIIASASPKKSDYWFYITDPITQKAIFAKNIDDHQSNIYKYLKN